MCSVAPQRRARAGAAESALRRPAPATHAAGTARRRPRAFRSHALTGAGRGTSVARVARPAPSELDEETIPVPGSVRFPVELTPPDGFDPARLETWPRAEGRLERVDGRLLYIAPAWAVAQL